MVLAFSGGYEIMEGVLAMIASPDLGAAWPGTQGAERDSQQDMLPAFSGATVTMVITALAESRSGASG